MLQPIHYLHVAPSALAAGPLPLFPPATFQRLRSFQRHDCCLILEAPKLSNPSNFPASTLTHLEDLIGCIPLQGRMTGFFSTSQSHPRSHGDQ